MCRPRLSSWRESTYIHTYTHIHLTSCADACAGLLRRAICLHWPSWGEENYKRLRTAHADAFMGWSQPAGLQHLPPMPVCGTYRQDPRLAAGGEFSEDLHFAVPAKNSLKMRDLLAVFNGEERATVPTPVVQGLQGRHPERYSTGERFRLWHRVDDALRLTMPRLEQLVINESVLALLALKATPSSTATPTSMAALLVALRLPHSVEEAMRRLHNPRAGAAAHLWQWRRPALLVLSRSAPFNELPPELKARIGRLVLAPHFS